MISERFLKIWRIPDVSVAGSLDNDEVNIFDAELPTNYRKLDYAIFFDQKIEVSDVTKLYVEVFKRLFELQPQTFFTTDLGEKIGLTKKSGDTASKQSVVVLNDTYIMEKNIGSNIVKFERIKYALRLFDFEDELIIKYAEK